MFLKIVFMNYFIKSGFLILRRKFYINDYDVIRRNIVLCKKLFMRDLIMNRFLAYVDFDGPLFVDCGSMR